MSGVVGSDEMNARMYISSERLSPSSPTVKTLKRAGANCGEHFGSGRLNRRTSTAANTKENVELAAGGCTVVYYAGLIKARVVVATSLDMLVRFVTATGELPDACHGS